MVYLGKELDDKSLSEKISHIWTEWSREDVPLFEITSKGSIAFKLFLWCLRYEFFCSNRSPGRGDVVRASVILFKRRVKNEF